MRRLPRALTFDPAGTSRPPRRDPGRYGQTRHGHIGADPVAVNHCIAEQRRRFVEGAVMPRSTPHPVNRAIRRFGHSRRWGIGLKGSKHGVVVGISQRLAC